MKHLVLSATAIFLFSLTACDDSGSEDKSETCGNGVREGEEECDGTDFWGLNCETEGYYGGTLLCTTDCFYDFSDCRMYGWCGDGVIDSEHGEECDLTNTGGVRCSDYGYYDGNPGCNSECKLVFDNCEEFGKCGDGNINYPYEDCEGETSPPGMSCESLGFYSGTLRCGEDCQYDESGCARCGDGIIQYEEGEECDGTSLGNMTCEILGISGSTGLVCSGLCKLDYQSCTYVYQLGTGGMDSFFFGTYDPETGDYFVKFATEGVMTPGDIDMGDQEYVGRMTSDGTFVWLYNTGSFSNWNECATYTAKEPVITKDGNVLFSLCRNFLERDNEVDRYYKFTKDGSLLWTSTEMGGYFTEDASGYIYTVYTPSFFDGISYIAKYRTDGSQIWETEYSSPSGITHYVTGIMYCGGYLYMPLEYDISAASVENLMGSRSIGYLRYDTEGNLIQTRELFYAGCTDLRCADAEYNYISGMTCTQDNKLVLGGLVGRTEYLPSYAELLTVEWDNSIFLSKYELSGNPLWFKVYNTVPHTVYNMVNSVKEDSGGNLYIGGMTRGLFPGNTTVNDTEDAYVSKFSGDGTLLWTKQWDDRDGLKDRVYNLSVDSDDNIMIFGTTSGRMTSEPYIGGEEDMFILHFIPYP